MKLAGEACLLGEIGQALMVDREPGGISRFACRPLAARSTERDTAYGFFDGQIGLAGIVDFREALLDLLKENLSKVIVDMNSVVLSRSAVGALFAFAASVHGRNKRLYIYKASPQVRCLLKEMQLTDFFSFLETEDDVLLTLIV